MRYQIIKRPLFAVTPVFLAYAVIFPAGPSPVFGQDTEPNSWKVDGRVIYSRDVPYGSAIGPRTPSREHSVNAGPTDLILKTIATGLEPMADDENAGVVAGTNSQFESIDQHIALGMSVLTEKNGSRTHIGGVQNSATGKAIGQATGAIQSAMDSMRSALGGDQ
jgi:hypothetical protein